MSIFLVNNITGRLPQGGEFGGYYGDCVEYSFMVAACSLIPAKPCNDVELNRLTSESIQSGESGSQGQMTNANLAWLCGRESMPYQQTTTGDLIAQAQQVVTAKPVCMGFSNGQALPGNEQNVFGHCIAVLDWDGTHFVVANGDSQNGRTGLTDLITPAQIAAAQPTQITSLEAPMTTPYDSFFTVLSPTDWLLTGTQIHLTTAKLAYWQSIAGLPALPTANPEYPSPAVSFQTFERAVVVRDPTHQWDNPPSQADGCYLGHLSDPRFGISQPPSPPHTPTLTVNGQPVTNPATLEAH